MKKKIIPVVVVLAVVAVTGALWSARLNRGNDRVIRLSGNLELEQVDMSFKVPGRLVERNVTEGDAVKKGAVIARLDARQALDQRARDAAGVQAAESSVTQLLTSIQYQRATIEGDVAARSADVRAAQALVDQLENGARPQEREQAQAAVQDARSQFDQASKDWQRAQELFQNEDISRAQRDQAEARFKSAQAQLKQAEERRALVFEGPRKEELRQGEAQLSKARAALSLAEANRIELKRKEQEVTARKAEVERARAQVGISQVQVEDMALYAPVDGVVLTKSAEPGEVLARGRDSGDHRRPGSPVGARLRSGIRFRKGEARQKVKVTTDSFPGKTYNGRITFIASEAEFTPKQIQTARNG